ncbi:circularly permuted type 2 ATP-grasp protein [Microbacterium sp. SORGH_AS_0888]|uniref:circularly permuted type 2 ATP-grasp protein n=1 Tax=Microbacterium sp. SORGH_AS_0888 TaxID=3041791 RepID=UPI00278B2F29|nr:circularly permuted type 2 ATP-grasp protein [Microbacterium sp. SORGH_AS_0888]MDQ1130581.1 putative alpha-E superfamily protein [Microbacterium sp. SORGH_AS_0888]
MILAGLEDGELSVRRIDGRSAELTGIAPDEVRARILTEPHRYVGRRLLPLSQAPAWAPMASAGGGTVPRQLILRAFTIRDGSAYRPLVGGLATLAGVGGLAPVTKDVWVLKAAESDPDQGLAEVAPLTLARATPTLSPRGLEDMFWAGRYAERAEDLLRLVLATQTYAEQLDYSSLDSGALVLAALRDAIARLCPRRAADPADELRSLLLDAGRPGSAAHSFSRLRDALEGVRDQLSNDTWRVFGAVDRAAAALRGTRHAQRIPDAAGRMLTGVLSLQGVTANMIQDAGWHMIELGRFVERALQLCALLQATATSARGREVDRAVLEGVLLAAESSVTHRRRHRGDVRVEGALELLLTDAENPRSVAFALDRVAEHLRALPASTRSSRPERLVEELHAAIEGADLAELTLREDGVRPGLILLLAETADGLRRLSDAVLQVHGASGPEPQALSSLALTEERGVAS